MTNYILELLFLLGVYMGIGAIVSAVYLRHESQEKSKQVAYFIGQSLFRWPCLLFVDFGLYIHNLISVKEEDD